MSIEAIERESMKDKHGWDRKTIVLFLSLVAIIAVRTVAANQREAKLKAKIHFLESELVDARIQLYRDADYDNCSCDSCMGDY